MSGAWPCTRQIIKSPRVSLDRLGWQDTGGLLSLGATDTGTLVVVEGLVEGAVVEVVVLLLLFVLLFLLLS